MGEPAFGQSLERVDNERGYSPENCEWETVDVQSRNRRANINLTFQGETMCLKDWAKKIGMSHITLRGRIVALGWSVEEALTVPATSGRKVGVSYGSKKFAGLKKRNLS